jgi:uncharacterized membrane protein
VLGTGERETGRDRDRIVNLSDGVFAIALTLLVLNIRVPNIPETLVATELPTALLSLWPKYLGYFLSFVVIGTFWLIHHSIFSSIGAYERVLLLLNFLFLMFVAFVPFPTLLQHPSRRVLLVHLDPGRRRRPPREVVPLSRLTNTQNE